MKPFALAVVGAGLVAALGAPPAVQAAEIIHDAEHYILEAQHGEKWAAEDQAIHCLLYTSDAADDLQPV